MILHADGNSFFASCEQIFRPDLRNKPVVVLSNNDGIIVALTKEAKALGLKRGDPYFKVELLCSTNNVAVFSSNYTLYADISRRITSIYLEYAPQIEEYSIDESFLFFENCPWTISEYEEIGHVLRNRILKEVGITICVGGAPTKTLAKLYNKKAKEHNGVFIYNPSNVDRLLESTDCGTIWGIGRARQEKLARAGITNALQLKNMPLSEAIRLMTIQGYDIVQELNGKRCIDRHVAVKKEIITTSRQFSKKLFYLEDMEIAVTQYTQLAVEKLRAQKCEAGAVYVFISTCNYYEGDDALKYSNGAYVELYRPTSYTPEFIQAAKQALRTIYRRNIGIKTVMITLADIIPEALQGDLWVDPALDIKRRRLMQTVDSMSKKYGRNSIELANGISDRDWKMKREYLSPCYTTRIKDIPLIE